MPIFKHMVGTPPVLTYIMIHNVILFFNTCLFLLSSSVAGRNATYTFETLTDQSKAVIEFYCDKLNTSNNIDPCHRTIGNVLLFPHNQDTLNMISDSTADCVDEFGNTPLSFAIASDNYYLIKRILSFTPDLKRLVGPIRRPYISSLKSSKRSSISGMTDAQLEEILTALLKENCDAIHIRLIEEISFRDELLFKPWATVKILKTVDKVCPGSIDYRDLLNPYKILFDFIDSAHYSPRFNEMCTSSIHMLKNTYFDAEIIEHARSNIES